MLNMLSGVFQNFLIWSDTVCTTFRLFFTAAPVGWRPVAISEGIKLLGSYINGSEEKTSVAHTRGIPAAASQTLESASCSPLGTVSPLPLWL